MKTALRCVIGAAVGFCAILLALTGENLWRSLPWPVRWWFGEFLFVGLIVGLVALLHRFAPRRPWAFVERAERPYPRGDRVVALLLWGISLSLAYPLFARGDEWGGLGDWDLHLQWYEALRISVLKHGQFPWWNPWIVGGWVLAAEPQFGLLSIDTPLVLAFGTKTGLKLALVFDLLFAVEGMRRLAMLWFRSPWAVATAAAIYAWNGAIVIAAIGNRAIPMSYPYFPWMLLFALRIERGTSQAIGLGLVTALSVNNVIQYCTMYAIVVTAVVIAWGARNSGSRETVARIARGCLVAAGVFLLAAGPRLGVTGLIFLDFPRKVQSWMDFSPEMYWGALLNRSIPPADIYKSTQVLNETWYPELASYVGMVTVACVILGAARGVRWWHVLILVAYVLAMGAVYVYQPSYWLSSWPVFSSMHVVSRWRLPAMLGVALAAGWALDGVPFGRSRLRLLTILPAVAITADLALYAHRVLPLAFSIPPSEIVLPAPARGPIESIESMELYGNTEAYECLQRGLAVIRGYCPQIGYDRGRKTRRVWRGAEGYVAEFRSGDRPVEPVFWSPNRIEFRLRPREEIEINQNPGSWWVVNGKRAFPALRCAEIREQFLAAADDTGRLVLEIRPRGLELGGGLSLLGGLIVAAGLTLGSDRRR